jgi:signal transduction histidine kinase
MAVDQSRDVLPLSGQGLRDLAVQVGHDVRSPLTAICSYAECLGWLASVDPPSRERYARAIVVETRRVDRMLADFMVLSGHRRHGPPEDLDFGAVLGAACDEVADHVALRGVALETGLGGPYRTVVWPAALLRHVVVATLDSVLTATCEGSALRVLVAGAGTDHLRLSVTTTGEALVMHLPRLLSYRAAALLLAERGGELWRVHGDEPGLALTIPADGRSDSRSAWDEAQRAG